MARYADFVLCIALALIGSTLAPLGADGAPRDLELMPIPPTDDAMWGAYKGAGGQKCKTRDCIALYTILQTGAIILDSVMTPNRIGEPTPAGEAYVDALTRPSAINRRLRITLINHPDRFPAICARIRSLASLYEPNATLFDEHFFLVGVFQMALLIDMKHQQNCLADALAALPRTPDGDKLVTSARDFCETAQWHVTACKLIAR